MVISRIGDVRRAEIVNLPMIGLRVEYKVRSDSLYQQRGVDGRIIPNPLPT